MIHSKIFDSFSDCLKQIENDLGVQLSTNDSDFPNCLLRGESFPWPKTESSMKRFMVADDGVTAKPFLFVSPFLDFVDLYACYLREKVGATEYLALGFLQHYGFPTDLFDFSPCVDTVHFFSCNGYPQEIGMVCAFSVEEMQGHFSIVNLSRHPFADRPRQQKAYVVKPFEDNCDLKDTHAGSMARWYRFRKSCEDLAFAKGRQRLIYPTEAEKSLFLGNDLRKFIKSHWTQNKKHQHLVVVLKKLDSILQNIQGPAAE